MIVIHQSDQVIVAREVHGEIGIDFLVIGVIVMDIDLPTIVIVIV